MNFNVDKFFTGVIDLFGILIPGAFLTYFFMGKFQPLLVGPGKLFPPIPTGFEVVAFVIVAYVIGHAVNGIGGSILDTYYYDRGARYKYTKRNLDLPFLAAREIRDNFLQTENLKNGLYINHQMISKLYDPTYEKLKKNKKKKKPGFLRKLISMLSRVIFKEYYEYKALSEPLDPIHRAETAKEYFVLNKNLEVINTYQWCKRIFSIHKMEAMAEVNRAEADQKFFRSLVVTSLIVTLWLIGEAFGSPEYEKLWGALLFLIIAYFSLKQYERFRFKNMRLAYEFLIAMNCGSEILKKGMGQPPAKLT